MMILQLTLVIGLNIYLPWRLRSLLGIKNKVWIYVLFAAGFISVIAAMPLITKYSSFAVSAYYNLAVTWLGIFLYLACFTVIFEIVNLIHKLPSVQSGVTIIALTSAVTLLALINGALLKTSYVSIPVKNLKKEIKIAQISDVHLGVSRGKKYLEEIVKKTNEFNPDIVAITGDIADSKKALSENMFSPLKDLKAPAYFVYGNHDVYTGLDEIIKRMQENNVKVLRNDVLALSGIKLIGLNYMKADDSVYDPHQVTDETIKDALPLLDLAGDEPKIVLHHGPWGIEYMNEYGIDAVIAGHTHAGQIFPAGIIAKKTFPYLKGLSNYNGTHIYVSQGAGTFLPGMRLGTNNEINFITLKPVQ
ncbi:MAG: metallophosphoesterase [Endomicrobium sp.]|jgi:predicted MPP superfamily phosphohydrolase|nr:metallophosphoesterase [Endomicrobium sp.]